MLDHTETLALQNATVPVALPARRYRSPETWTLTGAGTCSPIACSLHALQLIDGVHQLALDRRLATEDEVEVTT